MKANVPEIAWHNKNPVFTVDIQLNSDKGFYRAATGGGDSHIVIWHLILDEVASDVKANFAADLDRHIKAVNVVRFSKNGEFLASGDDDAIIIIWALKDNQANMNGSLNNDEINIENWVSVKTLRGHKDDIYDICWSPFSNDYLLSGSVDNTAIIWDVDKGVSTGNLGEHNGFVQGVAWDPKGNCLVTLSSDRALRIFDFKSRKLTAKVTKAKVDKTIVEEEGENAEDNFIRLFHDDTVKTFFRRLNFSPDGLLLFVPCGIFKESANEVKQPMDVTYVFLKDEPDMPVLHLPSPDEYTVAVKCCPQLFELNAIDLNVFDLPYRIIFAVASRKSIIFYDTQQITPFGFITDIHYATLTDISWSADGRLLLASSSDGYCTVVTFDDGELGVPYVASTPDNYSLEPMDADDTAEFEDMESEQYETELKTLDGESTVFDPPRSAFNKTESEMENLVKPETAKTNSKSPKKETPPSERKIDSPDSHERELEQQCPKIENFIQNEVVEAKVIMPSESKEETKTSDVSLLDSETLCPKLLSASKLEHKAENNEEFLNGEKVESQNLGEPVLKTPSESKEELETLEASTKTISECHNSNSERHKAIDPNLSTSPRSEKKTEMPETLSSKSGVRFRDFDETYELEPKRAKIGGEIEKNTKRNEIVQAKMIPAMSPQNSKEETNTLDITSTESGLEQLKSCKTEYESTKCVEINDLVQDKVFRKSTMSTDIKKAQETAEMTVTETQIPTSDSAENVSEQKQKS